MAANNVETPFGLPIGVNEDFSRNLLKLTIEQLKKSNSKQIFQRVRGFSELFFHTPVWVKNQKPIGTFGDT